MRALLPAFAAGCGLAGEPCPCEGGWGARLEEGGACQCLPFVEAEEPPEPETTFYVSPGGRGDGTAADPWGAIDWSAVDEALEAGVVWVIFDAGGAWDERLDVLRGDDGPSRLVLDGGALRRADGAWAEASGELAVVPGIHTTYEDIPRHRVTVRRFEVTGSDDKGVYWRAGDDVVLERLLVHDNGGSPSVSLEYSSRTGLPSAGFTLRNSHVYDQRGECVYIGGSEGEDRDAHARVAIEGNLVHDCRSLLDTKNDGINVKDRIGAATVRRNVVFATHWGIEAASPGEYSENLVFGTESNGFHLSDFWGEGLGGMALRDNAILGAGESGLRIGAENTFADGFVLERTVVQGSAEAGVTFAAAAGAAVLAADLALVGNDVGLDGWGELDLLLTGCVAEGNGALAAGTLEPAGGACERQGAGLGDLAAPAGPDGLFFTADDPWRAFPEPEAGG